MGDTRQSKFIKKAFDSEEIVGEVNGGYEGDEIYSSESDKHCRTNNNTKKLRSQSLVFARENGPTDACGPWTATIENYIQDRRRSSVDVIRRSRTLKRFSRAISAVSFYYQDELEYKLMGISELEVLKKIFEVFDYNRQEKLNQDEWIELLKSRLMHCSDESDSSTCHLDDKQVDFVEVVESVAYAVCGDQDITFPLFCEIFRTKNVLNKLFRLIDRDLDGVVSAEDVMEFISQLGTARSGSRLTKDNIQWLEKLFRQYVGDEKEIKKEDFSKIIQTKNQFFTDRVFDIFDRDASGSISLQEFIVAISNFASENPEDKIRFLFKVYDVDGDGLIQEAELEQVMRACMEENGMKFSDDQIHDLTKALFEDADVEGRGALTYDALKAQLEKHNGLLENLSVIIERWLVPPKPPKKLQFSLIGKIRSMKPRQFSVRYIKNNYVYLVWLLAFLVTNLALFVSRGISYRNSHPDATPYLIIARAAGQCLNFNCTFIVVVMLRLSLTYLRARRASSYIPIDHHINFHKMTGRFIFLFAILHTVMHLINIGPGILQDQNDSNSTENFTYMEVLFEPKATQKFGLVHGYAFNTGVVLLIILVVMVLCSLPCVRRGGCFEVFYWTHILYAPFWILLIIHAPNFWKWFVVPGVIFIFEQALRYYHWKMGRGKTHISSGILLPSKVTHLIIARPPNFEFRPGDYVFVRIPTIAKYEWHPFTISSGPEQEDALWLHIRAVGQWTNRLYEYFEEEQSKMMGLDTSIGIRPRIETITAYDKRYRRQVERQFSVRENSSNNEPIKRTQLKSIADSIATLIPESDNESGNPSGNDIISSASVDEIDNRTEGITNNDPNQLIPNKLPLTATKSMPNVFQTISGHEKRNLLRVFVRSESVNVEGEKHTPVARSRSSSNVSGRGRSAAMSVRNMRYKPQIIELQTPNSEEDKSMREKLLVKRTSSNNERLAEEGRSRFSMRLPNRKEKRKANPEAETEEPSFYELGTTRISGGSVSGQSLEIFVDGPYGAPSSHIFRAQHAVLIATGIGVTPFASILQSIMRRYWASRNTCPSCNFTWCSELPQSVLNLQKVDFFWINRDQRSFEWFVHLLSQLEIEQAELGGAMERFLDMHMYITSALQRTDMKAVGLQLALDLLHEKEKRDLITGLKTRTNAGRPNWTKIFQQLADQHKGKVTVFYCGPPALARSLKIKCDEFNFTFRKELF